MVFPIDDYVSVTMGCNRKLLFVDYDAMLALKNHFTPMLLWHLNKNANNKQITNKEKKKLHMNVEFSEAK